MADANPPLRNSLSAPVCQQGEQLFERQRLRGIDSIDDELGSLVNLICGIVRHARRHDDDGSCFVSHQLWILNDAAGAGDHVINFANLGVDTPSARTGDGNSTRERGGAVEHHC